ncbi:hypothetical protein DdX_01840 [Ditylenchus destructor]|uniref:Uncharacterized protein n=1 Tax=Ditylenchus destructor TaxID=166010 RepID=A0AAD4RE18_9BILA|nr:hypothetical protein DdX_01840 [Ditylenchus destructor]
MSGGGNCRNPDLAAKFILAARSCNCNPSQCISNNIEWIVVPAFKTTADANSWLNAHCGEDEKLREKAMESKFWLHDAVHISFECGLCGLCFRMTCELIPEGKLIRYGHYHIKVGDKQSWSCRISLATLEKVFEGMREYFDIFVYKSWCKEFFKNVNNTICDENNNKH